MPSLIQPILHTLAGHSSGLSADEIAARIDAPYIRVAGALYSASQRGHVAKITDADGSVVFSITPLGVDALGAMDILAQRMDEKCHAPTRQPPAETELTKVRRAAQAEGRKRLPEIDNAFALAMARYLHKSKLSLPPRFRARIANIVEQAA